MSNIVHFPTSYEPPQPQPDPPQPVTVRIVVTPPPQPQPAGSPWVAFWVWGVISFVLVSLVLA